MPSSLKEAKKVKNMKGTRKCKPKVFKSWKNLWSRKSGGKWPKDCKINGCAKSAFCGGHVKFRGKPSKVFIIPLCRSCNAPKKGSWMKVDKNTKPVPVTKKDTCGPKFCASK